MKIVSLLIDVAQVGSPNGTHREAIELPPNRQSSDPSREQERSLAATGRLSATTQKALRPMIVFSWPVREHARPTSSKTDEPYWLRA